MKKFAIIGDSSCDLSKELREKFEIDYVPMRLLYEDKDIPASLDWDIIGYKEMYDMIRNGVRIKTAQVNTAEYKEYFEKWIKQGYDVLSLSCTSALSSSYYGSLVARDELKAKYPDANIICIDSRTASFGLGILCLVASKFRSEGKSIEETAKYIEDNKIFMNQFGTVEELTYLKRAGRVSAMTAFFGGMLQVKPIIVCDVKGGNVSVEKVKGRKNSLIRIADMVKEVYVEHEFQVVGVGHADCGEDGETLKQLIIERLPKDVKVVDYLIGPIIGATSGPGMLGVYLFGKEVTLEAK